MQDAVLCPGAEAVACACTHALMPMANHKFSPKHGSQQMQQQKRRKSLQSIQKLSSNLYAQAVA